MKDERKITILGRKNSINVMKVVWCCVELNLPFERIDVGGAFAFDNVPDYLELNPNGRVPTIRDGGTVLWESNVIVRYLSEQYGRGTLWPKNPASRWEAEKWMDWQTTQANPGLAVMLQELVRTTPENRNLAAVEDARKKTAGSMAVANAHLGNNPYMAGETFTMGDIPMGCIVYRWFALDIERPDLPHLKAYHDRLKPRPGYHENVELPLT